MSTDSEAITGSAADYEQRLRDVEAKLQSINSELAQLHKTHLRVPLLTTAFKMARCEDPEQVFEMAMAIREVCQKWEATEAPYQRETAALVKQRKALRAKAGKGDHALQVDWDADLSRKHEERMAAQEAAAEAARAERKRKNEELLLRQRAADGGIRKQKRRERYAQIQQQAAIKEAHTNYGPVPLPPETREQAIANRQLRSSGAFISIRRGSVTRKDNIERFAE